MKMVYQIFLENTEGAIKKGQSRETGTQDEDKQNKNTTQCVLDTITPKLTNITYIRHVNCNNHRNHQLAESEKNEGKNFIRNLDK